MGFSALTKKLDTRDVKIEGVLDFASADVAAEGRTEMQSPHKVYIKGVPLGPNEHFVFHVNFYQCPVCGAVFAAGGRPPLCDHNFEVNKNGPLQV